MNKGTQHQPPKDIRVELRFRNNLLFTKMQGAGFKTVAELVRATSIDQATLGRFINMKKLPLTKKGAWRRTVLRLAEFFQCLPEELFSGLQQEQALEENRAHVEMHSDDIRALLAEQCAKLLDPEAIAEERELHAVLDQAIGSLEPRYQTVIRARFGLDGPEMTYREIGLQLGVSHARVWQIEAQGLRLLRKLSRSGPIREAAGIED